MLFVRVFFMLYIKSNFTLLDCWPALSKILKGLPFKNQNLMFDVSLFVLFFFFLADILTVLRFTEVFAEMETFLMTM